MGSTWVVSDVHGHLADLRQRLEHAGLVDGDRWVGGDDSLWVLGDLVDRGPDGIGVVRFVRGLVQQAPDQVRVLMGNHEALMLGQKLFPDAGFADVWAMNGGRAGDQRGLTEDDVSWLRSLPPVARTGDYLLVHSDTTGYLAWGATVEEINATVAEQMAGDDPQQIFDVFAALTDRFDFAGSDGAAAARSMLTALGGHTIVHGHSIIGLLLDMPSSQVTAPLRYADGQVIAVDGGRYDGGPLLLVRLD